MENKKVELSKKVESRRNFVKKAAYAIPTVVALGQIVKPSQAEAVKPSRLQQQ